ncbi:MAG: hypothetical protein KDI30_12285 [Pseudomonadales bacterium]|nr:hypothetical protein [Pseudomonadales bacterium]
MLDRTSSSALKWVPVGKKDKVYIAFSPNKRGRALLAYFDEAVAEMKKSGQFQRFALKYNVQLDEYNVPLSE